MPASRRHRQASRLCSPEPGIAGLFDYSRVRKVVRREALARPRRVDSLMTEIDPNN
jgi:hypothetical protein